MDEIDEKLERIKNFADEVETNPNLYLKAERLIGELYGAEAKARKQKRKLFWVRIGGLVSACAVACTIVIAVPFIYSKGNRVHRFLNDELSYEEINNLQDVVEAENIAVEYFDEVNGKSSIYTVKESGEVAILSQEFMYVTDRILDSVEVDICLLQGEFEKFEKYDDLSNQTEVLGVTVAYESTSDFGNNIVNAYFSIDSTRYYMTITNMNEYAPDGNLSEYVRLLLN
jgi:hypothetical protein